MKRYLPVLLLLGGGAAFVFGVLELFKLRFESGDVYPPYSSLRSDPLGTMAFYESLDKLPGMSARRDYSSANRLPEQPNTTYLHLASSTYEWRWLPDDLCTEIRQFLARGGRLVVTLEPQSAASRWLPTDEEDEKPEPPKDKKKTEDKKLEEKKTDGQKPAEKDQAGKKSESEKPTKKKPVVNDEEERRLQRTSLRDFWGIDFAVVNLVRGAHDVYEPVQTTNQTDLPLPRTLAWHSGIVCSNLDSAWRKIYTRGTNATVVERRFGQGSVVFATDSYFLSNEAMLKDRHADLLAWMVGSGRNVVFDEAHLGVVESSGVAVLMRKYRLHWLAGGLVLLAGLFIWKNSVSLVPPFEDESQREIIAGKDAAAGFVNLLRRSIPVRDLLATCFAEWSKSAAPTGKYSAARLQQADAAFQAEKSAASRDRDPLRAYRDICAALRRSEFRVPGSELQSQAPNQKENQ